jgi:hypothetical protein
MSRDISDSGPYFHPTHGQTTDGVLERSRESLHSDRLPRLNSKWVVPFGKITHVGFPERLVAVGEAGYRTIL